MRYVVPTTKEREGDKNYSHNYLNGQLCINVHVPANCAHSILNKCQEEELNKEKENLRNTTEAKNEAVNT